MVGLLWPLLVGVLAGAVVAVQAPINAELARGLGSTIAAATISFLSGAIVLALLTVMFTRVQGAAISWHGPEAWLFVVGGCLGAVYVTSTILLISRLGAAVLMAFFNCFAASCGHCDRSFGFFGVAMHKISIGRIADACFLILGAAMVCFL